MKPKKIALSWVSVSNHICEVPGHVKLQLFSDPDGNLFHLCQELSPHKSK